jgi:hypothetical protein
MKEGRRIRQQKPSYEPTPLDEEILEYVRQYYFLAVWHLMKLLWYAPGSLTRAQTKLQTLAGENEKKPAPAYLRRRGLYLFEFGNSTNFYFLGTEGMKYHTKRGNLLITRHRRIDHASDLDKYHLLHCLQVNDVLIAGRNLPEYAPDISLAVWQHDYELQRTPFRVEVDRYRKDRKLIHKSEKIEPDGLLDFRLRLARAKKERRRLLFPEIDRGTETFIDVFKRKICAYVHFFTPGGPFEEQFGKAEKRVVWIVTEGGIDRIITLRQWCEDELEEQKLEYGFDYFRFVLVDKVVKVNHKTGRAKETEELDIHPVDFFLRKGGYKPFSDEQDTLLWRP